MFKKGILIAFIVLCLGIIGCTGPTEPNFNSNSTYNVVSVSKKPIDYWLQSGTSGLLRQVHFDNNAQVDKIYVDGYGELAVTHKKQDYGFCKLNQNHHSYESVSIRCNVLGDTLTGVCMFGGQYSSGGPGGCCRSGSGTIGATETVDFIAVRHRDE